MGGEELKWRQLAHYQLMSQEGPHFSPHSKAKANYKSINLRKIGNKWFKCCSVRFSSLQTHLKKLMNMITRKMVPIKRRGHSLFFHSP